MLTNNPRTTHIIIMFLIAAVTRLSAATFVVSDLGDAGPGTLRQAILDANANVGDDAITFSTNGIIVLATNLPAITDNTAINGPGTNLLTINGAGKYSMFWMTGQHTNSVSDLILSDARTKIEWHPGAPTPRTNASGFTSDGALILRRCVLTNCMSLNSYGGAIYSSGTLDAEACSIINCGVNRMTYYEAPGGGIYNTGSARIKDSHISGCSAGGGSYYNTKGGGINNTVRGSMDLRNVRIERCDATDAGGINNNGAMVINDCVITRCNPFYWFGGICANGVSTFITNTIISENSGSDYAGGILAAGNVVLSGCTISSNRAYVGAGILVLGVLKAYNCTVSGNNNGSSSPDPSAIADYGFSATGKAYLNHCTVISNNLPFDVSAKATFTVANCILGKCAGTLNSEGQNLFITTNGFTVTNNLVGNIYNVDPLLGPLQNNGGSTLTMALLPGSPAIDAALDGGLSTDQRGFGRAGLADIGAFEVSNFAPLAGLSPNLQIIQTAPGSLTLSWPASFAGFVLQQRSDLASGDWADVTIEPTNNGATAEVFLSIGNGNNFFRLRGP